MQPRFQQASWRYFWTQIRLCCKHESLEHYLSYVEKKVATKIISSIESIGEAEKEGRGRLEDWEGIKDPYFQNEVYKEAVI